MTKNETITAQGGIVLHIEKRLTDNAVEAVIELEGNIKCLLHWGLRHTPRAPWQVPPREVWPEGSKAFGQTAVQTPFAGRDGKGRITIRLDRSMDFSSIDFVLFFPEEDRWDNNRGRNYSLGISIREGPALKEDSLGHAELAGIIGEIIDKETGPNSWTLMHRFNLCYDLLDRVKNNIDGLAIIYIWLRFSFIRQLDWQRNYNTKPRELGHSMDRLTLKLAARYTGEPGERKLIRLIMTTLGRGGNAQRVRDEVLNIMHRHHIKEVSGHFMEEWHQKLHNNTTPDDIVICEGYLEFLRSNGNLERFYNRLKEGGVTKERLEGYERPIRSHPDFIPHLKDALLRDFEHFLGILKAVHTGIDLGTAIHTARHLLDPEMHGLMDFIWSRRDDRNTPLYTLLERTTEARRRLIRQLTGHADRVRDLLFLDLALEDFLRTVVERNLGTGLDCNELIDLAAMTLENLCLSGADDELLHSLRQLERLRKTPRPEKQWPLRVKAAIDRLGRALAASIDRLINLLQPKAVFLGSAFHADPWTINLFSEEAARGRPAFALAMLLRYLDPLLHKSAGLGNWQVISRGHVTGEVKTVSALRAVQGNAFDSPVIIIADNISGDEEIPKGVGAIITPAVIDILAHLSVRARNDGVLFATCYAPDIMNRLKSLAGHMLRVDVNASGDVLFEEGGEETVIRPHILPVHMTVSSPVFTVYALQMDDFNERDVGGKSNNLRRLRERLPDWVGLPPSVALPFGVFERALAEETNKETSENFMELLRRIGGDGKNIEAGLAGLRKAISELRAPDGLVPSLHKAMVKTGLPVPSSLDDAWACIKRVWSSKWNERAYLSRTANGIPHEDLFMAVLIQKVIEADYSFVIHTVNPFTGLADEVYAEVVPGLGETLVGNYPGKALGFTCKKGGREPHILSFPSKGAGLFGGGLIFRSDSSVEDLAGYAGAGLYDSFMLPPAEKVSLDYSGDKLLWDDGFRRDFLVAVAEIGRLVENILQHPQDIEGAYCRGRFYIVQARPQVGLKND